MSNKEIKSLIDALLEAERKKFKITSMATDHKKAIMRLFAEGTSTEGFIYHMAKIILWYEKDDSWYQTLYKDCKFFANIELKPKNKRLDKTLVLENLFDPLCENERELMKLLSTAEDIFRDEIDSKSRLYDIDSKKLWNAFEKFRESIIHYICYAEDNELKEFGRNKMKEICEVFNDILKD